MMHPRPPTSTLFPYTTLFRSGGAGGGKAVRRGDATPSVPSPAEDSPSWPRAHAWKACWGQPLASSNLASSAEGRRSEEHTSELQSRENLVCRLLLEKKKKYNK